MRRRLPSWLIPHRPKRPELARLGRELERMKVHTVCQSAKCPNLGECFGSGNAAFMILGDVCTRDCGFCAVGHGRPASVDPQEPHSVATAAAMLGLHHVVITSVTRDDLVDGGARHFASTIRAVRELLPNAGVEVLVPDFGGSREALELVMAARPDVLNHNVETVPRLYRRVRPQADYARSLSLLQQARTMAASAVVKSGFMVGLGEQEHEVLALLHDLRRVGVEVVTVGQYLQPSKSHMAVERYVEPEEFSRYESAAAEIGFAQVLSGPLVRSSYHAAELAATAGRAAPDHASKPDSGCDLT